jgi:REP element-mobilizing transposase RayT
MSEAMCPLFLASKSNARLGEAFGLVALTGVVLFKSSTSVRRIISAILRNPEMPTSSAPTGPSAFTVPRASTRGFSACVGGIQVWSREARVTSSRVAKSRSVTKSRGNALSVPGFRPTQLGNGRRFVLDCDADRSVYLNLLRENAALYKVSVIGYCLMSNHIHLIAVPRTADGLAQALKHAHGRYASYWNASSPIQRARVARTILFLPARRGPSMGRVALHRADSLKSRFGSRGGGVALVERG